MTYCSTSHCTERPYSELCKMPITTSSGNQDSEARVSNNLLRKGRNDSRTFAITHEYYIREYIYCFISHLMVSNGSTRKTFNNISIIYTEICQKSDKCQPLVKKKSSEELLLIVWRKNTNKVKGTNQCIVNQVIQTLNYNKNLCYCKGYFENRWFCSDLYWFIFGR